MLEYALKQERYCIHLVIVFACEITLNYSGCDIHNRLMAITLSPMRILLHHSHHKVCKHPLHLFFFKSEVE